MLDDSCHQVAHVLARDAACGRDKADGLAVAAKERDGNANPLAVLRRDLQPV
jgi:hypothetical protein